MRDVCHGLTWKMRIVILDLYVYQLNLQNR